MLRSWTCVSKSTSSNQARRFTDAHAGVIFKLTVQSGKVVDQFSWLADEQEVLLSPLCRLFVSRAAYDGGDGFTYVDMVEQQQDSSALIS